MRNRLNLGIIGPSTALTNSSTGRVISVVDQQLGRGTNTFPGYLVPYGQQLFTTTGSSGSLGSSSAPTLSGGQYTYTFVAPASLVSVVCIGGGGSGGQGYWAGGGGGGGGLGYKNNISLVPGQNYTVVVGSGGVGISATAGGQGTSGSDSYLLAHQQ